MVLSLSRPHLLRPLSLLLVLALTLAPMMVYAQVGDSPLERVEASSTITQSGASFSPNDVLAGGRWIKGDADLQFAMRYECVDPTTDNRDSECEVGEGSGTVPGTTRTVHLRLNLTGGSGLDTENCTTSNPLCQPLTAQNRLPGNRNPVDFTGTVPQAKFASLEDGDNLTWIVQVRLNGADASASCSAPCQDPQHTTGEAFYRALIDRSIPEIVVTDPSNANVFKQSGTEWYLYSSQELSNFLPVITLSVIDDQAGSPLNGGQDDFEILRESSDHTDVFDRTKVTDHGYAFQYRYSRAPAGESSFGDDSVTKFTIKASDVAGHQMTATLWVAIDKTAPVLVVDKNNDGKCDKDESCMKRKGGKTGLAALGEELRVYINATDDAGRDSANAVHKSPGGALAVTARFQGGPNNGTFSQAITIPYNETLGYHHSPNVTIPSNWVNGPTFLNVTVADPVGNSVSSRIIGSVNVDTALPVIDPKLPLAGTISSTFTKDPQVTFRIRASDPGDADEWEGAQTDDTDDFGIDLESVRLRYKVGPTGVLQSSTMSAQEADHIFQSINTFDAEDDVYFFFEAKDLAGNLQTYPRSGDPHIALNGTENGGRYLFIQVDQKGPTIEPAKDHSFIGTDHQFRFRVQDGGVGLDTESVRLHWRNATSGNFQEVGLTQSGKTSQNATLFLGTIPTQIDGTQIQYYVTAADKLDNIGSLGSVGSPRRATIDLTAPVITLTAPETSTSAEFNITWSATDTGSGVANYTLQFRIAPGGKWFTVPTREETTETFYNVCAAGEKTYEFRLSARDRAGNERPFPATADATTFVDTTTSCAKAPEITISRPSTGETLRGDIPVQYSAVSTTHPEQITVRIEVGTAGAFTTIANDLDESGTYTWKSASLDLSDPCVPDGQHNLRVVAVDPNGLEGTETVGPFTLNNGIVDCSDRDHDGLPDAWEMQWFNGLDAQPNEDADKDGFTNLQEWLGGTDPTDADDRPSGRTPGNGNGDVITAGWDNLYILVILAFAAILAVFVIGMTRRW